MSMSPGITNHLDSSMTGISRGAEMDRVVTLVMAPILDQNVRPSPYVGVNAVPEHRVLQQHTAGARRGPHITDPPWTGRLRMRATAARA